MLAKVLARAVEASFHRGDTGVESFSDLGVAAAFLHQRQQSPILRPELSERMTQRVELLGVHGARRLGNIFVLFAKRQKNPAELLAAQLIDARVSRQTKKPRLELRGRLQAINGANHFDEDLLREILDVITSTGHGVYETGDPMLIADDELSLSGFVALLSPSHKIGQRGR